jgi:hypothetical protein
VNQELCSALKANHKSPMFIGDFALSHSLMLAIIRHARKFPL